MAAALLCCFAQSADAIDDLAMDIGLSNVDASFLGETDQWGFAGSTVVSAGDVNGDGYDDFLIGSYKAKQDEDTSGLGEGWPYQDRAGKVYLMMGKPDPDWGMGYFLRNPDGTADPRLSSIIEAADHIFVGEDYDDRAGMGLAGVGDVNGDGYDDFVIGAYLADHFNPGEVDKGGRVYLILGKAEPDWGRHFTLDNADAIFGGINYRMNVGWSVDGAGDVNNDGYDDFLIGTYAGRVGSKENIGKAFLILGRSAADWGNFTLSNADASYQAIESDPYRGSCVGWAVAGAGDVNGDSFDDFLISATGTNEGGRCALNSAGKVYLILGRASGWSVPGSRDLILSGDSADAVFLGSANEAAGFKLAGAGDVNGDGFDDFLISAIGYTNTDVVSSSGVPCNEGGKAYLISGRGAADWGDGFVLSTDADASFVAGANDAVGSAVESAGDVDGDGYADFVIGAHCSNFGAGKAYLIRGNDGGVANGLPDYGLNFNLSGADASFVGGAGDYAGNSAAGAGDVDGDGLDDLIIGAWYDATNGTKTGTAYLVISPENPNTSPVADIGADLTEQDDLTRIDLTGSCEDADGEDAISGWWSYEGLTACVLSGDIEGAKASGRSSMQVAAHCTPDVPAGETLTFVLHCDDGIEGVTAPKPVDVNAAPLSNNQSVSVDEDAEVTIALTGSDPDAEGLEYEIIDGPDAGRLEGDAPALTYIPNENYSGVDSFTFRVNDGRQDSPNTGTVSIDVDSMNDIPVANAGVSQTVNGGSLIRLDGTGSNDSDFGTVLTYRWSYVAGGPVEDVILSDTASAEPTFRATRAGFYTFSLTVNDGVIDSDPASVVIRVNNIAPVIHDGGELDIACNYEEDCSLAEWEITDANEDDIVTSWTQLSGDGILQFTDGFRAIDMHVQKYKRGIFTVRQVAVDGMGGITNSSTVRVLMPNNAPVAQDMEVGDSGDELAFAVNRDDVFEFSKYTGGVRIDASFLDHDGDELEYGWQIVGGASDRVFITSSGGNIAELKFRKAGTTYIDVMSDDGHGGEATERIAIVQPVPNITDINFTVTSYEAAGAGASDVDGNLELAVWPIVRINGVNAAITLSEDGKYLFTARGVPNNGDPDRLDIKIYTEVDGEEVLLESTTISMASFGGGTGGTDGDSGDGEAGAGGGTGGDGISVNDLKKGGCGCMISSGDPERVPFDEVIALLLTLALITGSWKYLRSRV